MHQIKSYLNHWLLEENEHSLHAPFIYDFYKKVVKARSTKSAYLPIEKVRSGFLQSDKALSVVDYGSGSANGSNRKQVKRIASFGISRKKYGELLDKIADYIEAEEIVELGTSLGITTLYLSCEPHRRVITMEGDPSLCAISQAVFDGHKRENIKLIEGNIDHTLAEILTQYSSVDLVFFDANHTYQATIDYFETMIRHKHDGTCFVFDDIHRDTDMERAWKEITKHFEVTLSIDLFQVGIIFFNPEIRKQHYILNY